MTLSFKRGVSVYGLHPEILWALDQCVIIWNKIDKNVRVTSGRGGKHSRQSRHYSGLAVDLGIRDLTKEEITEIHGLLVTALPVFDVVLESDHLHIEYDPKNAHTYPTIAPFL